MRVKGINLQQLLLAAMLLAALCWNLANAAEIKQLRVETTATGTRAEVQLDREGSYKLIELRNPDRLVVDFPASRLSRGVALPPPGGAVQAVRTGQPQPGTVRVVFELSSGVRALPPRVEAGPNGPRLVLEWPGDGALQAMSVPAKPAGEDPIARIAAASSAPQLQALPVASLPDDARPSVTPMPGVVASGVPTRIATGQPEPVAPAADAAPALAPAPRRGMQGGMRPLVVAIDPGHGGQDPGAVGPKGLREKDVTLAIARELARQVNATPGMKAFLTRDADMFLPLHERARRANANKADIFLSIHADAAENRNARGSSVYVLSTKGASSQRARWLADKENAADIIGGERGRLADNTLATVLLDLTQSGNMKASEDAAGQVLSGLKRVGNNHKPAIERANFAVLRTSDKMPAMLVETAFISNADEERRLADPSYQRSVATAILDGVDRYFSSQPPPGTLYAARAQAVMAGNAGGSP